MSDRAIEVLGQIGLGAVVLVWVLLAWLRVGGAPIFLLCFVALIASGIFCMRQAQLQARRDEFGGIGKMFMALSWWIVGLISLPVALIRHFPVVVS